MSYPTTSTTTVANALTGKVDCVAEVGRDQPSIT